MKSILTIQYLRAVAALLVVAYHHMNSLRGVAAAPLPGFELGAFGVDIFFVISGFIMWTISTSQPTTPGGFIKRRIIRIVPAYWAFTLIVVFVSTENGLRLGFEYDLATAVRSFLFIPDWNPKFPDMTAPVLIVGWTLNLEMMFYALFTAALFLPLRLRLGGLLAALTLMGTARLWLDPGHNAVLTQYSETIILEFGFGVLLGRAWMNGLAERIERRHGWGVALGLFTVAAILLALRDMTPDVRALYWGVPALLIVAGGLFLEPYARAHPSRSLKFLGDASYSIYLTHLMAMALSQKVIGGPLGPTAPWTALILESIFAAAFGCVAYLLVERPATNVARCLWARDPSGALRALPGTGFAAALLARAPKVGKTPPPEAPDSQVTGSLETE